MRRDLRFLIRWGTFMAAAIGGATACSLEDTRAPESPASAEQLELRALLDDGDLARLGAAAQGVEKGEAHALARPQAVPDGGVAPPMPRLPFGLWSFNDCNSLRTQLFPSGFDPFGAVAFRAVAVACTTGIEGQGVAIAAPEDIVYVPDQPHFLFGEGVTVAAWVKPDAVGGTKTIIRKRDKGTSSFALVINQGRFQFVVGLGGGAAASVTAPTRARPDVFQHVAGTYDGTTLRLYVGGVQVSSFVVPGTIQPGAGPLLVGNDGNERRMNGVIDNVVLEGRAMGAADVQELTCFRSAPTTIVTPQIASTPAGIPATFDVAITNNSSASCAPEAFTLIPQFASSAVALDPPMFSQRQSAPVASGATGHMTLTATPSLDMEPQETSIGIVVSSLSSSSFHFLQLIVTEPTGCHVNRRRELMITHPSVVDDFARTTGDGPWSFKHLMEAMAPSPPQAPAMVETMLRSFTVETTLNGLSRAPRPGMEFMLANWPRTESGELDLAQAPLRLQAIVNRFDLRDLDAGNAGEGRFVFAFEVNGFAIEATMILEYKLPAATEDDVRAWADAFHGLPTSFGEEYNQALAEVTERFASRGRRPNALNGSALDVVRTNEISFSDNGIWELREFRLDPSDGFLRPFPVDLTPDLSFNGTPELVSWINDNAAAILAERHVVPMFLNGVAFRATAVFNSFVTWFAPGVDPELRHKFALNTCNGCHSTEAGVQFLQIIPRFPGNEAGLSPFLTGTTVFDPSTFQPRTFNDLARRIADLEGIVCATPGLRSSAAAPNLRKGISRVH